MASDPCAASLQYDPTTTTTQALPPGAYDSSLAASVGAAAAAPIRPTPFLTKTYELVDDPLTNTVISWSNEGTSFVVWNPANLCQHLLPRYFKHSNFSSFVRQLNTYGFRKIAPERWEFANDDFQRGQRHLLGGIHRRRPSAMARPPAHHSRSSTMFPACGNIEETGKFGVEAETESLKKDKKVLSKELLGLQQQLESTMGDLHTMWQRLQMTETFQQHMISFISKAIHNPGFLAQIRQQSSTRIANIVPQKRRLKDVQSTTSSTDHLYGTGAALLSGNDIVNPHQRHHSMEVGLSTQAKADWNETRVVDPPLKTLDELVEDSKLMRSAAINNSDSMLPCGGSFIAQGASLSVHMPLRISQSSSTHGAAPCNIIHPDHKQSWPAVSATFGEQLTASHSVYDLKDVASSSKLSDQQQTLSSSKSEHLYEYDIDISASRSSVTFNTQYSASMLQESASATRFPVHAAPQWNRFHAADGPSSHQYDKYHAADIPPAHQYDHFNAGNTRTTYSAVEDLVYNAANPSGWGRLQNGGLETLTPPQQEAQFLLQPSSHRENQGAPGYQKDT